MTRWKASGLHLVTSIVVISTIVGLIYALWFPHSLIRIAGMDRLIITMLMVDIVAGPLLTLIVFKAHDIPQTRRDLAVIALLQLGFLGYALHTAWISRPVFLVWSVDAMHLLYANDLEAEDLRQGREADSRSLSWRGPRLYAIDLPKDHENRAAAFTEMIRAQTSLERLPKHYGDYAAQRAKILRASQPATVASLPEWMPKDGLASDIDALGRPAAELRLVPLSSSRAASMLLIDGRTAAPLRALTPPPAEESSENPENAPK
jgi:hypothetical protein